jgi:hypothetical protein
MRIVLMENKMSIQDDAFNIERALNNRKAKNKDYICKSWLRFQKWAYEMEIELEQLRFAFNAYKTVIKVYHLCLCGEPLSKGNNIFCKKCAKLPKNIYGFPIRKR